MLFGIPVKKDVFCKLVEDLIQTTEKAQGSDLKQVTSLCKKRKELKEKAIVFVQLLFNSTVRVWYVCPDFCVVSVCIYSLTTNLLHLLISKKVSYSSQTCYFATAMADCVLVYLLFVCGVFQTGKEQMLQ